LRHIFKSWESIDIILKAGIKLTHLNKSVYHPTN